MALLKSYNYGQLSNNDEWESNASVESSIYHRNQSSPLVSRIVAIVPWLLASIFGITSVVLWTKWPIPSGLGSYEIGFNTDFRGFGILHLTI